MSYLEGVFDDIDEQEDGIKAFEAEKKLIIDRCKKAGFKAKEVDGLFYEDRSWLSVEMPAGRSTKTLLLSNKGDTSSLLSIEFEKICMLGDYAGICSYSEGIIEAGVRPVNNIISPRVVLSRLFGVNDLQTDNFDPITLQSENDEEPLFISLGKPSAELAAFDRISASRRTQLSIRIYNITLGFRSIS
jgi:hypothetical protein